VPLLRVAAARTSAHEKLQATVVRRRSALAGLLPDDAGADLMRKEERARRDELVELGQRREDAIRLTALGDQLRAAADEADALETKEAELALFLTESPAYRAILRTSLVEARARAAALPMAGAAVDSAAARLEAARLRDSLAAELSEAEAAHRAAVDAAQAARDVAQEARQARLDGMAASLAVELAPGEPCRVCGSAEHPSPAHAGDEGPGEEAVAAAEAAYEEVLELREAAGSRVSGLAAELAAAATRAGDASEAELASELAAAQEELAGMAGAEAEIDRIEDELRRVDVEFEEARDRHGELQTALAGNLTHRNGLTEEAERLRARIDAARGDDPTLEARIQRLGQEADLLRDTATATDQLRAAAEDARTAWAEAGDAATAEDFPSPDAARAAALDEPAREELLRRAKTLDDEEARVAELLEDPELTAAAAQPTLDLAALEATLAAAEDHHQAVSSALDRFQKRRDRLAKLAGELRDRADDWRPAAEHHALAVRVAALTSGDPTANRTRMRLSAYVLAARLEQVVAAANERLARMSGTRYSLEHTVDRTAGERGRHGTGGLGLRVIDGWTGRHREPGTLSGGETFITSLALALGLADVVTTEAGGTEIGTLFVDEGFGTLDEDTLDEVMEVLDGLRDGGRAVGIVSHVAELRTRIPAQLQVRKARTGSTLKVTA
jgi:exonuclease SbcC